MPATTASATSTVPATHPPTTSTTPAPPTLPVDLYSVEGWLAAENRKPGSTEWRIDDAPDDPVAELPLGWIEGYAGTTSATHGERVTLFVDTPADSFRARAFRMGWYGGRQGRVVWDSGDVPGGRQSPLTIDLQTGMAEAPWHPSIEVAITADWPPGAYLILLETGGGGAHHVPLTIRHDAARARLLFMSAVTTWQAYNPWGGCTLYECFASVGLARADVVSFDRPYSSAYHHGAADFPTHELPLISFIEQLGIDTAYVTNVDVHRDPALAASRRALISPGHDEYYSPAMRASLVDALDARVNLAFFGANAVYRRIRFEPGGEGAPDRRIANFRRTSDPGAHGDPSLATVNWRDPPLEQPEAEIVGIEYACAGVHADMRQPSADRTARRGWGCR